MVFDGFVIYIYIHGDDDDDEDGGVGIVSAGSVSRPPAVGADGREQPSQATDCCIDTGQDL